MIVALIFLMMSVRNVAHLKKVIICLETPTRPKTYCWFTTVPAGIYLFKVNNGNTRTSLTSFCVFVVNFEHISHIVLMFPLITLHRLGSVFFNKFLFLIIFLFDPTKILQKNLVKIVMIRMKILIFGQVFFCKGGSHAAGNYMF